MTNTNAQFTVFEWLEAYAADVYNKSFYMVAMAQLEGKYREAFHAGAMAITEEEGQKQQYYENKFINLARELKLKRD